MIPSLKLRRALREYADPKTPAELPPGLHVIVVGAAGEGKSTVAEVIRSALAAEALHVIVEDEGPRVNTEGLGVRLRSLAAKPTTVTVHTSTIRRG